MQAGFRATSKTAACNEQDSAAHLGALRVRRAVCAQEELGAAADSRSQHGLAVLLALQHRQAEGMWSQAALADDSSASCGARMELSCARTAKPGRKHRGAAP